MLRDWSVLDTLRAAYYAVCAAVENQRGNAGPGAAWRSMAGPGLARLDKIRDTPGGNTTAMNNLRTLCRRCHVLRSDRRHRGMIAGALRDGIIPADWRREVWEG